MVKLAPLLLRLGGEDMVEPRFSPLSSQETERDEEGYRQDLPFPGPSPSTLFQLPLKIVPPAGD